MCRWVVAAIGGRLLLIAVIPLMCAMSTTTAMLTTTMRLIRTSTLRCDSNAVMKNRGSPSKLLKPNAVPNYLEGVHDHPIG